MATNNGDIMYQRILLSTIIVSGLSITGCQIQPTETAATGAPPAVQIPVGTIPGTGEAENLPTNPYKGNNVALSEGRQLFINYNCYGCHGGHAGGGMGPSLRDKVWIYGGDDAHIFASIAQGRSHGMPAWGVKIPRDQIWKLVAYVQSLGTDSEADPPPPFEARPAEIEAAAERVP